MFKSCLGRTQVFESSDEIVKSHAFDTRNEYKQYSTPKYKTYFCNDYELHKLLYLGSIGTDINALKHYFGSPQRLECYKGQFSFELIWYIKFKDGTDGSITKYFKNNREIAYCNTWKVSGNNDSFMKHIILLLL
jgi:hypothetical protein